MAGVRAAARRGGDAAAGDRSARWSDYFTSQVRQGLAIAAISVFLLWVVWIYGNSLRDPRYLDGWLMAAGMSLQVYFHIRIKTGTLSPKAATSWRKLHIFLGYVLGAVFISHTDYSLPDTAFEWTLWTGFVSVTLSGIFGTYLAWAIKGKGKIDERTSFDRIPARRAEIAKEIQTLAKRPDDANPAAMALPSPPYHAWIVDLYTNHLQRFLPRQANSAAHLIGSQRPLKRLIGEIDNLSGYVDQPAQDKLAAMKELVIEKDRLDFARVHLGLAKAWLFVHVPVTYGLVVMVVLHVIVNYSFSSGVW
jgi:hypothetical protein